MEDFSIEDGVLSFKKSPDFEDAGGHRSRTTTCMMTYVTVQATDSTNVGTKEVMSEVTNVDEPGKVTLSALRPQSAIPCSLRP